MAESRGTSGKYIYVEKHASSVIQAYERAYNFNANVYLSRPTVRFEKEKKKSPVLLQNYHKRAYPAKDFFWSFERNISRSLLHPPVTKEITIRAYPPRDIKIGSPVYTSKAFSAGD